MDQKKKNSKKNSKKSEEKIHKHEIENNKKSKL
jgi:hypothetical protein